MAQNRNNAKRAIGDSGASSSFFRDPEAFAALGEKALPRLVERAGPHDPVRAWVPGCATGEEAYSIAMLLVERFAAAGKPVSMQIFGTDVDEEALAIARRGAYRDDIETRVSPERLQRFFVKADARHYGVEKRLREAIVFGRQDLLGDPPLSRMDLVSCRNVLSRLDRNVRSKIIVLLHFALKRDGYLLLGPSESIGQQATAAEMFERVSGKWRLFRRIGPVRRDLLRIPVAAPVPGIPGRLADAARMRDDGSAEAGLPELAPTRPAPRPAPGRPPARRAEATSALDGLREELRAAREELHAKIDELECANEKLHSYNERITSMNEELQCANEELESSKTWLQSLNEQLRAVNSTLHEKVEEAARTNDDLRNLVAATEIAALFLDRQLSIKRFTPLAGKMLHLIAGDVGRPLRDLASRFDDDDLLADAQRVAETRTPTQKLVLTKEARAYLRRIMPYRRDGDRFGGVVVTLIDVTAEKALREEIVSIATLEQQRIGQELHDGTQQELTGLGLLAQSLSETLDTKGARGESALAAKLAAGIAEANRHVHELSRGLFPIPVGADRLEGALADLASRTESQHGLRCRLDYSARARVSDDFVATHLYRLAQEAVTNAVKHAEAETVSIALHENQAQLRLEVADDGKGIAEPRPRGGGVGLRIMEHRCALIGGSLSIRRRPGGGTLVSCALPRAAAAARGARLEV